MDYLSAHMRGDAPIARVGAGACVPGAAWLVPG
jgi:hypothetical protein